MGYQPLWVAGQEVGAGLRDCNGRYQALATYLRKISMRPRRVLEIGAYTGYFCRRLAEDFGAQCIAVDDHRGLEAYPGVEVIKARLDPLAISSLGRFDVVICMSVLHHHNNWHDYLTALLQAGDVLFIETANPLERLGTVQRQYALGAHQEISALGRVLTQTPPINGDVNQRPLWVVDQITLDRDGDEKVKIVETALRTFLPSPASRVVLNLETIPQVAEAWVETLDFLGWDIVYCPEKIHRTLQDLLPHLPPINDSLTPCREPERHDDPTS